MLPCITLHNTAHCPALCCPASHCTTHLRDLNLDSSRPIVILRCVQMLPHALRPAPLQDHIRFRHPVFVRRALPQVLPPFPAARLQPGLAGEPGVWGAGPAGAAVAGLQQRLRRYGRGAAGHEAGSGGGGHGGERRALYACTATFTVRHAPPRPGPGPSSTPIMAWHHAQYLLPRGPAPSA